MSDDWNYTNSVIAAQTSDTSSGSMFRLRGTTSNPARLYQEIAVIKGKNIRSHLKRGEIRKAFVLLV